MEWIRCNSCGYYPSSLTRLSIFLTSCGHLICSKCLERADATGIKPGTVVCLQCRQPCKTVKLGPDSQPGPEVTFYFGDEVSAVKKLLQAVQFQKMHYELGTEMAKRKRLLWEIKEGERQEKELVDLGVMLDKLKTPLANVLEGVREKARRAGSVQPPQPQEFMMSRRSHSTDNSPLCSPAYQPIPVHSNNIRQQTPTLRTRPPYPFNAAAKQSNQPFNLKSPTPQQHRSVASPLSTPLMSKPGTTLPGIGPNVIARSPVPQHVGTTSPFSTPPMPKPATVPGIGINRPLATQHGAIPAVDPRITPNHLTWSQSQYQQRQSLAPGVGSMMTPIIQSVGPHHMHGYHTGRTANFGVQQHAIHPLNSVRSMHASYNSNATGITGRSRSIRTMVPGSVLSQAAPC